MLKSVSKPVFDITRATRPGSLPALLRRMEASRSSRAGDHTLHVTFTDGMPSFDLDVIFKGCVKGIDIVGGVNYRGSDVRDFLDVSDCGAQGRVKQTAYLFFDYLYSQAVNGHALFKRGKSSIWHPEGHRIINLFPHQAHDFFKSYDRGLIGPCAPLFVAYLEYLETKSWPDEKVSFENKYVLERAVSYAIGRIGGLLGVNLNRNALPDSLFELPIFCELSFGPIPYARFAEFSGLPNEQHVTATILRETHLARSDLCTLSNREALVEAANRLFRASFPSVHEQMFDIVLHVRRMFELVHPPFEVVEEPKPQRARDTMPLVESAVFKKPQAIAAPPVVIASSSPVEVPAVSFEVFYDSVKRHIYGCSRTLLETVFGLCNENQRRYYITHPEKIRNFFAGRNAQALEENGFSRQAVEFR